MHSCDVRHCVNPLHLSLGTSADNMIDCREKGRLRFDVGQDVKNAKLTDQIVEMIRREYVPYKNGFRKLASRIGVSESCVHLAYHGQSWKHVTDEVTP